MSGGRNEYMRHTTCKPYAAAAVTDQLKGEYTRGNIRFTFASRTMCAITNRCYDAIFTIKMFLIGVPHITGSGKPLPLLRWDRNTRPSIAVEAIVDEKGSKRRFSSTLQQHACPCLLFHFLFGRFCRLLRLLILGFLLADLLALTRSLLLLRCDLDPHE